MPSLKSHIVALVLRHTRKKAFASPQALRLRIDRSRPREDHRPPAPVIRSLAVTSRSVAGFPVYEVVPPALRSSRRILYLHGGAYCFEITPFHWKLIAELCERLGCRVTVPIYPLAPEHDFHAIFGMVGEVYRGLLREVPAGLVDFVGDSAGGNMALVLTMMAAAEGLPAPARHVLISPGLDMTLSNPAVIEAARRDPWLDIPGGLEAVRLYAAGIDFADWRISPAYGDLAVLPPALIFSGTRELLHPDTLVHAERLRRAGREFELVVGRGMFHVWPLIDMPEARAARDRMVEYLARPYAAPEAPTASSSSAVTG